MLQMVKVSVSNHTLSCLVEITELSLLSLQSSLNILVGRLLGITVMVL